MEQTEIQDYKNIVADCMLVIEGLENIMKMLDIDERLYKDVIMYIAHHRKGK